MLACTRPFSQTKLTPNCTATTNPTWGETFVIEVDDASKSQLEVTLWDGETQVATHFLGEVLLNVGKLEPWAGTEVKQTFPIKAGHTVPVNADITGTLSLVLQYNTEQSFQKLSKGFTLSLDKNFDLVKPEKSAFESAIAAEMVPILKTDPSRLEFVGTERWKPPRPTVEDKGDASVTAKGTLVHINILPPLPKSSDKRSVADLQAELQAMVDDPGKDNAMYASKPLQGLSKIEWHAPFRKLAPTQTAPKQSTPASAPITSPPASTTPKPQVKATPPFATRGIDPMQRAQLEEPDEERQRRVEQEAAAKLRQEQKQQEETAQAVEEVLKETAKKVQLRSVSLHSCV